MTSDGFEKLINLAAGRLGAETLSCSDDFFAPMENLVKAGRGIFIADKYTEFGKWMDGWESRRKRSEGHDWCVLKLGLSGVVRGVDIDTNHFLGNHPPEASIEGACIDNGEPSESDWTEILPKSHLEPGSQNLYSVDYPERLTHLRLHIYPDGGVARLKVYGDVIPNWSAVKEADVIDLASVQFGGLVLGCNDMFFSSKDNLIMPGRGVDMGDGWETKRRRGPGHDWAILRMGAVGKIDKIEVDTHHFKGNFPDRFSLEGVHLPTASYAEVQATNDWQPIMGETKLKAHKQHYFDKEIEAAGPFSHIRMNIFPDGGVSRLRIFGTALEKIAGE